MSRGNTLISCMLFLAAPFAANAVAATLQVPSTHPTIGDALSDARDGDRILVQPGIYRESGLRLPAGVVLAGVSDDPSTTVIDGMAGGRILEAYGQGQISRLMNLTFRNGRAVGESSFDKSGGALFVGQSTVEIINCVFESNLADAHGGAVRLVGSDSVLRECVFRGNAALRGGGGALDCSYLSSPELTDCTFEQNLAAWGGAIAVRGDSHPEILRGAFYSNRSDGSQAFGGGAVSFFESDVDFRYCTFYGNRSDLGGAVAALPGAPVRFEHCTVAQNVADEGGGLFSRAAASEIESSIVAFQDGTGVTNEGNLVVQISCTNVHGNSDGDLQGFDPDVLAKNSNLSADPVFCELDDTGLTFNVDVDSPCATNTACGTMGAWMVGCSGTRGVQTQSPAPRVLTITGLQATPNPFNPTTRIRFELQSEQRVRAEVFSIDGRRIRSLADREFSAGWNVLPWNGQDDAGRSVGSGAYIVRLQGEAVTTTQKVLLLK